MTGNSIQQTVCWEDNLKIDEEDEETGIETEKLA